MATDNFTINDLGNLGQAFSQVIAKYNLSARQQLILNCVKNIMLGKIDLTDFIDLIQEELQLDFIMAGKIAAELKINILDKKAEIEAIKKNWQQVQATSFDPQNLIKEILTQTGLKFTDPALQSRFDRAILSWFKDVRDSGELKDTLTKSPKIGGIGFSEEAANAILNQLAIQKAKAQRNNQDLAKLISDYEAKQGGIKQVQESEIDVAAKVATPQNVYQQPVASPEVTIDQILQQRAQEAGRPTPMPQAPQAPVSPVTSQTPQTTPFIEGIEQEEQFLENTEELPSPVAPGQNIAPQPVAPQRAALPPIRPPEIRQPLIRQTDQVSNRPQMSDVKFEPKLYGPLDELAAMSLADFRRLSKDPWQSIQKISGKIAILEGESMVRKNEGIRALKSSPLYNIYADIMNRALVEGKTFEQVIAERGDINITEFKAIMELNKSLKY